MKEHEHNQKILRTAYLREQKRQLDMMNDSKQRLEALREEQRKEAERKA